MTRTERIRATINGELDRQARWLDAFDDLFGLEIVVKMNGGQWPRLIEMKPLLRHELAASHIESISAQTT